LSISPHEAANAMRSVGESSDTPFLEEET